MRINGIDTTSIAKINGIAIASIIKIAGVTLPEPPPSFPSPTNAFDAGNASSYPGSGATWYNISGSSNTTLINGVAYDSGDGGGCLTFDGASQYGTAPYDSTFDFSTGNYTINTWVKFNAFGGNVTSKDTYGVNFDWCMYVPADSTIVIYSNGASTNVPAYPSPVLSSGTWYQLTIASISNVISIYVNGVLQNTPTYMSISNNDIDFLTIGCFSWSNPNTFFNGKIAVMEYYNVGLTDAETATYFDNTKARYGY
jgi:hypothetical protein